MRLEDYVQGILYLLHNPNFEDPLSDYFCIAREQGRIQDAINSISANNLIESSINLINRISSTYDDTTAGELERRFINAIKSGDPRKFKRGIAKVIEAKNNDTK